MTTQLVSVIIPMYNAEETIERALNSILNQTRVDFVLEVIVIDDGSSDGSYDLVSKYRDTHSSEVNVILHKQNNAGVSTARNTGMSLAKGNWFAFLDSDDAWFIDKLEKQFKRISENPKIQFLSGNMQKGKTKILFKEYHDIFSPSVKELTLKSLSQPSTVLMERIIFDEMGGFDPRQKYAEDGNYFLKVCAKYGYYHDPIQIIEYGFEKRGFGQTGLSGNLVEMQKGNIKNLKETRLTKEISLPFYLFSRVFYSVKYLRRIIVTRISK